MCRRCEQVWVPKTAEPWIEAHAARVEPSESTPAQSCPDTCANCGAPFGPDSKGRCRYCRADLVDTASALLVLPPLRSSEERLTVGGAAGAIVESIFDLLTGET